ncbi:hypothetical protein GCM10022393_37330 [Aquimarina addita]|uniref:Fibronectin type-III domain-containing protein n=1 Tax=Aquimarina addita TaxID=870485 RepID=A0ABP6UUD0_9FLAO
MNRIYFISIVCLGLLSCNTDNNLVIEESLDTLVRKHTIVMDNVIACASSTTTENTIIAYVYPRPETTDIRYYETTDIAVDKSDYQQYQQVLLEPEDVFNGYLKKMTRITPEEKWVIITFFENDTLHLSNPIRLKHLTKPTEFADTVTIDDTVAAHPVFSWQDGVYEDSTIYFQVVSDTDNSLLSGTYTIEKTFQYYVTDNVVLNITDNTPPDLTSSTPYTFTLMGVSEDNWVNLFTEKKI